MYLPHYRDHSWSMKNDFLEFLFQKDLPYWSRETDPNQDHLNPELAHKPVSKKTGKPVNLLYI